MDVRPTCPHGAYRRSTPVRVSYAWRTARPGATVHRSAAAERFPAPGGEAAETVAVPTAATAEPAQPAEPAGERRSLLRRDVAAEVESVPLVRHAARQALVGRFDEDTSERVLLLLTELLTNAIQAMARRALRTPRGQMANQRVAVAIGRVNGAIRIEVADSVPRAPEVRVAGEWDENGRGLYLVCSWSRCWGWEMLGATRKVVWCEVATH